ncbi:MAG TPA: trypsin-like serine protease [Steroidobacteraceae bacterium]|nr:trypsin-like serine protease [Steroidobacteraceae bacterium]
MVAIARAVVIRDGIPDSRYLAPASEFPPLADLPIEGHGTLIARQWVVTAAHAVHEHHPDRVTINGKPRAVAGTVIHPGFEGVPTPAVMAGDAAPLMRELRGMLDIALLQLVAPVEDTQPAELYRANDEVGKRVTLYGKGATGTGASGEEPTSPHRGLLRRAYNRVSSAERQWLTYVFDCSSQAPLLEGVIGSGDSGGPVLIDANGSQKLAGITSWRSWRGDLKDIRRGVCGQRFYCSRVSHYADWIDHVVMR